MSHQAKEGFKSKRVQGEHLARVGRGRTRISWLMPLTPGERPELLAKTLLSLRKQTMQADELIIAADGPTPVALMEVIKACDLPWELHSQECNLGIGATLAKVALLCRGDLIVRIDSDDLYAPEHTAAIVRALEANPKLGVVGCQLLEVDMDKDWYISARCTPTDPEGVRRWLPWRNPLNHQTVAIRREALLDAGGYRHCPGFEDWDLWLRIARAGYLLTNLPIYTAAARVNRHHLERRWGWRYSMSEYNFYWRQLRGSQVGIAVFIAAVLTRLPWRLLPRRMLEWWMRGKWRGSPTINTAWISQFL